MKKRHLQIVFLILTICNISCKQKDKEYFISSGDKKISFAEMDNYLNVAMDSFNIPGLAVAIINNSEIVYHRTFGVKNKETREKIDEKTLFEAASFSKPLFAYFVMKQVEKGLLDLDKPLYEYLANPDIEYDERYKLITARMVLSHQTGFPNWRLDEPDNKLDIEFDPGTSFQYSGEAYQYLASVIASLNNVKEGKLDSIFQVEVANPLRADYLYYNWNDSIAKHKAYGHRDYENKLTDNGIGDIDTNQFGSAHSLHSEPISFSKYIIAMLKKEGLADSSFNELLKEQVKLPEDNIFRKAVGTSSWTLGLAMHQTTNGIVYSHFGDNGDFTSYFNFYPNRKSGMILFSNSDEIMYTDFITKLGLFLGEDIKCDPSQFD